MPKYYMGHTYTKKKIIVYLKFKQLYFIWQPYNNHFFSLDIQCYYISQLPLQLGGVM